MRARITVSVAEALVKQVDRARRQLGLSSRSAAVERALELLVKQASEREIGAALDAYFGTLSRTEQDEERRMVRAFNRSQRKHDLDREGR